MATKEEWKEFFELTHGREPSLDEFLEAKEKGEITDRPSESQDSTHKTETNQEISSGGKPPANKDKQVPPRRKRKRWLGALIAALLLVILSGTLFVILYHPKTEPTVAVSGVVKDRNGKIYSNQSFSLNNQTIKTDKFGQFVAHIVPNQKYQVNTPVLNFSLEADKKGKMTTSSDISPGITVSTSNKTVQFDVKPGVVYLDGSSHYSYDSSSNQLTFSTDLQIKKNDKIVLAPSKTATGINLESNYLGNPSGDSTGYVFSIDQLSSKEGKFEAKVSRIPINQALNSLAIHTGEISAKDLGTTTVTQNPYTYALQPTDFTVGAGVSGSFDFSSSFNKKINPNLTVNGETDFTGKFEIDAVYNFFNPKASSITVTSSLALTQQATLDFQADYNSNFEIINIPTPILGITVPVDLYADAHIKFNPYEKFVYSPQLTLTASGANGFNVSYGKTQPTLTLNVNGSINGEAGIMAGPSVNLLGANLLELYFKGGFDGNATVSTDKTGAISGNGQLNFGVYLGADSEMLNDLTKSNKFTYEKEVFQKTIFNGSTESSSSSSSTNASSSSSSSSGSSTLSELQFNNQVAEDLNNLAIQTLQLAGISGQVEHGTAPIEHAMSNQLINYCSNYQIQPADASLTGFNGGGVADWESVSLPSGYVAVWKDGVYGNSTDNFANISFSGLMTTENAQVVAQEFMNTYKTQNSSFQDLLSNQQFHNFVQTAVCMDSTSTKMIAIIRTVPADNLTY